jgi:hypothetical protein
LTPEPKRLADRPARTNALAPRVADEAEDVVKVRLVTLAGCCALEDADDGTDEIDRSLNAFLSSSGWGALEKNDVIAAFLLVFFFLNMVLGL